MATIQEELYKKDLHDPDNHDGVITHLEPDIPGCEVKWALGSITRNKASGDDRIAAHLFEILKDDAVKVLHSISQQIWKTQQWPQDWKIQFSLQSQDFPGGSASKESTCSAGDLGSISGWEDPLEKEKATYSSILA